VPLASTPGVWNHAARKQMNLRTHSRLASFAIALLGVWLGERPSPAQNPPAQPGLVATFSAPGAAPADTVVMPAVALYVGAGQAASPWLAPGPFTVVWEGLVSVDLRGDYQFAAEVNGRLKVEINGATVLESGDASGKPSDKVRLNKGANLFKATYTAPASGDAFVRLQWIPRNLFPQPIPASAFTHQPVPQIQQAALRHLGRELVLEHRCTKCHLVGEAAQGPVELAMDAPTFHGIGSRRGAAWLARWIADPAAQRATARMPQMFHGPDAAADAAAIAAYLATLTEDAQLPSAQESPDLVATGAELAAKLHCAACHSIPGEKPDPARPALKHVKEKFPPGALAAFLQKPEAHFAWTRMPNFQLTAAEAAALAAWLDADAAAPAAAPAGDLARGRELVQTTGCLNCHAGPGENKFSAKPLAELAAGSWTGGCLADKPAGRAPFFGFTAAEREALQAFAAADRAALTRHVPAEFAGRQTRVLNCRECHGKFDGFPQLEHLGGKLRPEWTTRLLAGALPYKPRPWIESRMPAFASRAAALAAGLAAQHGFPPVTPAEPPVDMKEAQLGQRLVSSDGGFSCIACHAVGEFGATQVFESAGINLARAAERLLPSFYVRWMLNPQFVDPQTKMPVYFDAGQSPLADVHGGDALKQIHALWQYFRLGEKMPPPAVAP
jgi:cytochrome c1